jgi:hypothetical protein
MSVCQLGTACNLSMLRAAIYIQDLGMHPVKYKLVSIACAAALLEIVSAEL